MSASGELMLSNKTEKHFKYTNPKTGHTVEFIGRFNWLAFFFSPIYYWYKGMIYKGFELLLVNFFLSAIFSAIKIGFVGNLITMFLAGFLFDSNYKEYLVNKGYLNSDEDNNNGQTP